MASEELTKGIVVGKLSTTIGYAPKQNEKNDGIIWFKEDSYKGTSYDWLKDVFSKATKRQTLSDHGTPDFIVVKEKSNVIIIIECKAEVNGPNCKHSMFDNVEEYTLYGYGTPAETEQYAINGALYYATFLSQEYDVVAIGISGQSESELRVSSFVIPKGGEVSDMEVLEDGGYKECLTSINQYEKDIDIVLNRFASTEEIRKELRKYTLSCANFLRSNGIEDNSKAGFVSAIVLGLTNKGSRLYRETKSSVEKKKESKAKKMISDSIGKDAVRMLKDALYGAGKDEYEDDYIKGVWDIDEIPKGKRKSLRKFYDVLLSKDELTKAPKGQNYYFSDGDTVLSCCIYSLYENVIEILEHYKGMDIMGEFYITFLRFTKGNAKEKGIVLTPKHITDLFCDIAEYYGGQPFSEKTKILDTCCGTGAFLISALAHIKDNIRYQFISEQQKEEKYQYARTNSLIGVERDASMYALAYANMRFHGDGKANLFNCSSLMSDSYNPIDDSGMTYMQDGSKVPLSEALKQFGDIDVALINPPYSIGSRANKSNKPYPKGIPAEVTIQKGQDELDFIASMLHYIKMGGIGIAIVPMSCAGNSGRELRKEILKYHTLLACMTMPANLFFDSHVGTATCIMVFKAHIPHDEKKAVFFARWQDDGFKVIPHNGRKDSGAWSNIRIQWLEQIDGIAEENPFVFMRHKIKIGDEALAEAYIKTDYSKLTNADFERTLKKYALYKYMGEQGMLEE